MNAQSINFSAITFPATQDWFERAHPRTQAGYRLTLELLGIPLPAYAIRKPAGRPNPAKRILRMMAETGEIPMPDKVDAAIAAYSAR